MRPRAYHRLLMADLPARVRLVIFDLDGVVYRGTEPIAGAASLVGAMHDAGVTVRFATNNSMITRSGYAARLRGMGIETSVEEIVTSTTATIEHLARHASEVNRVLAVGASGMLEELALAGFDAHPAADAVSAGYDGGPLADSYDAVVVGLDPAFDYPRLAAASSAIAAGAMFVATNADRRYPTASGFLPGAGSMVAAIAAASAVEPLIVGKPQPRMFLAIAEASGVPVRDAVVIGDNPDADVIAARRAGIASILVLTGVADRGMLATLDGERCPDAVAAGPPEVLGLLAARLSG